MPGVLLSRLIQLFLVHKLFFPRARFLFFQPFLTPVHSVRRPARRGEAQMPVAGWFAAARSLAPRALLLLAARTNNCPEQFVSQVSAICAGRLVCRTKGFGGAEGLWL